MGGTKYTHREWEVPAVAWSGRTALGRVGLRASFVGTDHGHVVSLDICIALHRFVSALPGAKVFPENQSIVCNGNACVGTLLLLLMIMMVMILMMIVIYCTKRPMV